MISLKEQGEGLKHCHLGQCTELDYVVYLHQKPPSEQMS